MPTDPVHFLLVDDLAENILALDALLRRDGLVTLKARSGPDALELLLVHDVALALVDVQMPGMDGFELAELMRGTERTRRVPIIFLTAGTADRQRRFRGYEAGAVDFLHKPIEPDVLRSKADVFFDLYRQRQEVARQRDELRAATDENARLLQESRQYAEALREADRRKDEFLAMLAHELRNPLAPIRNAVEVLRRAGAATPPVERARDIIARQTAHMARLVDDLMDVNRITRGKIQLRTERVLLKAVVTSAVEASRPVIDQMAHALTVTLPPEPIAVEADATRLAQVFMNLLNNAAKYSDRGGKITLTARRDGAGVAVAVRDSGIGIAADQLARVFDLFAQVERSLEKSQGGLGIGLTLVKRLVELHGGTVEAHSEGAGRGSEFVVRLPVVADPVRPPAPTPAPPEGPADVIPTVLRILIVDDNRDGADSLAMMLRITGHDTRSAYDGERAVVEAGTFKPDVVLLDIGLPKLDGYQACRRIRELPGGRRMVLIAQTGWGQEEDRRKSREAGFDHHMVKPVDPAALLGLLAGAKPDPDPPAK